MSERVPLWVAAALFGVLDGLLVGFAGGPHWARTATALIVFTVIFIGRSR